MDLQREDCYRGPLKLLPRGSLKPRELLIPLLPVVGSTYSSSLKSAWRPKKSVDALHHKAQTPNLYDEHRRLPEN